MTIELVMLPASVVLGIVHIIIAPAGAQRIGHWVVGGNRWQRVIENAAAFKPA